MKAIEVSKTTRITVRLVMLVTAWLAMPSDAQALPAQEQRPASASGTVVVPERFIRRWDPVTIFFDSATGPAHGGPEDRPGKFVSMTPAHPGAYTWLDARTLQFKPAEPWPPLARVTLQIGKHKVALATLMSSPTQTAPQAQAENLMPVADIELTFPEPIPLEALSRMLTIELRPLPGVGAVASRWLGHADFKLKALPRKARTDEAQYVVALTHPIPFGVRALLHFRLSLDELAGEALSEISFSTAPPFRVVQLRCSGGQLPLTPEGAHFGQEQALRCGAGQSELEVDFSAPPRALDTVLASNFFHLTPPVEGLTFSVSGRSLIAHGHFAPETIYKVALSPVRLSDERDRVLEMSGASSAFAFFPKQAPFLNVVHGHGVVERFGPQYLPLEGRGQDRIDVRIFKIDPLDRNLWPFPERPVRLDESQRPPGPGEEPARHDASAPLEASELAQHLRMLGSPQLSQIIATPLRRDGAGGAFGLDMKAPLAQVGGKDKAGSYLVGVRKLDGSNDRLWSRLEVTDLALSTLEEPTQVRFVVTSLASGTPVSGAQIVVEGERDGSWVTFTTGSTNRDGQLVWAAPGERRSAVIHRIVIKKGDDVLVLDPSVPPEGYQDNQWFASHESWLQWTQSALASRPASVEEPCHFFPERPVYRPEETVYLKGYLRLREKGRLAVDPKITSGHVVVEGPGDLSWRYPVTLTKAGSFAYAFTEKDMPTGTFSAHFESSAGQTYCHTSFQMEAYRLPQFELVMHGPDRAALDREFKVSLTAAYYAGGRAAGLPVRFRVTQFPFTLTPANRPGFVFSSDARFSKLPAFHSQKVERQEVTDVQGGASITLNPALEGNAAPRRYVVEATVTGADDQTVTATRSVIAAPAFVIGLKVPRTIEKQKSLDAQLIVVGPDDKTIAGQKVTVRLLHRQWHSYLAAGDFSSGAAKYVTDVVDEKVSETVVTSTDKILAVPLALPSAGVFVVEAESRDRLGRSQVLAVDFFSAGDEPVAWSKPANQIFSVATDKASYDPGDAAQIVLKSPFQNAHALVVVEAPSGNIYSWLEVKGGSAVFRLPIHGDETPRVPVHFLLMRGRVSNSAPIPATLTDLGKPATMAATAWVVVNPLDNRVDVSLQYPDKAQPGDKVQLTVTLKSPKDKKPLAGEVTLWLVDQAVLALAEEQRLDPLPDFITAVRSHLFMRDTRNDVFGFLPFAESPGGDGAGQREDGNILDRVTVRKNFKTVPYYQPTLEVGDSGTATVTIALPDNLTNFKLRAKAAAGAGRFGFATGMIAVRLPLLVQPALPRFVRPGDTFMAAGIGRVVEGPGGAGAVEIRAEGAVLKGDSKQKIQWRENAAQRIEVPVEILTPPYDANGKLARKEVSFSIGVMRQADSARDAFKVSLPLRDDRSAVTDRLLVDLEPGKAVTLPALSEAVRPGTLRRSVLVSSEPAIVKMAAGLDFLLAYPHYCTEQRLSQARARLALAKFRTVLAQGGAPADLDRSVNETLAHLSSVIDGNGLVAYWPGARGYVHLTAWSLQFVVEAESAGYRVDGKVKARLVESLRQALRSDYTNFVSGEAWEERAWALMAETAAGEKVSAYVDELGRDARYLDLEGSSQVLMAYERSGSHGGTVATLAKKLTDGVIFRLYQGNEIYGGLQALHGAHNGLILPSETRTLAEMTRALYRSDDKNPRLPLLRDALVTLGGNDGWGSTNASAEALLALAEVLQASTGGERTVSLRLDGKEQTLELTKDTKVRSAMSTQPSAGLVTLAARGTGKVVLRSEVSYVPLLSGSQVAAAAEGFVVEREWQVIRAKHPAEKTALDQAGRTLSLAVLDVVEDHVQVVNPKDRNYVAVVVPLAAGMEPLNPALATAPPEAAPNGTNTQAPTYVAYLDDQVTYYYDTLPKGTFDFYFRTRAAVAGRFIQPAAHAEMMYDMAVRGSSPGAVIAIAREATP